MSRATTSSNLHYFGLNRKAKAWYTGKMSELRPPTRADLDPFVSTDDAFDLARLMDLDEGWRQIYDPTYATLEEHDKARAEAQKTEFLMRPEAKDHVLGYVYAWCNKPDFWTPVNKLIGAFASEQHQSLPQSVDTLFKLLNVMLDEGTLKRHYGVYGVGPQAPLEKFPELGEEFESWVFDLLSTVSSLRPRTIVLEHYGEDITSYEFWGAKRKLYEMLNDGKLRVDQVRCMCLPQVEDAELDGTLSTIDTQLSESAERALRQFGMDRVRIVKPQQRGSNGGIGRKRDAI